MEVPCFLPPLVSPSTSRCRAGGYELPLDDYHSLVNVVHDYRIDFFIVGTISDVIPRLWVVTQQNAAKVPRNKFLAVVIKVVAVIRVLGDFTLDKGKHWMWW